MKRILCTLILGSLLAACHENSSPKYTEGTLDLSLPDEAGWTFVSIETGEVIGTCALDDSTTLRDYAHRADWDVAISSDGHLRTNSGRSGDGLGGICKSSLPFDAADVMPEDEYLPDTATYELW